MIEALDYKTPMPQWNNSDSEAEDGDDGEAADEMDEEDEEDEFDCSLAELTGGDPSMLEDGVDDCNAGGRDDDSDDEEEDDGGLVDGKEPRLMRL